jgi:hypothetical protein
MENTADYKNIIIAPRPLDLTVYFILGICLLLPGAMLLFASLFALVNHLYRDFIIGLFFATLPLGLGAIAFIASAKGRTRIFFDIKNNHIRIIKRGAKEKLIEIDKVDSLHSQRVTYPFPGIRKYSLNAIVVGGNESIKLFDETLITPAIRWEVLAKKLAHKIDKPLKAESRVEDKNLSLFNLGGK